MQANGSGLLGRAACAVRTATIAHIPPIVVLGVFAAAYLVLLDDRHLRLGASVGDFLASLLPLARLFLVGAAVAGLSAVALTPRRGRSLRQALRWLVTRNWLEILLLRIPFALLFVAAISYFHLSFKINIPSFVPYSWDQFFASLDRMLFLGWDPWVLSHQLMPGTLATQIFNLFYMLWFFLMKTAIFCVALLPLRHPVRLTFLTAYGLNWLIAGALLAIVFASAGPVYMERITGDATFAPLMQRLHAQAAVVPLQTLEAQEWLWDGYTKPDVAPYGISAFPSLHLAITTTCACLAFTASRALGWILATFTGGMLIASVHLGWHYAVDGFVGIALALAFWRIAAYTTGWWLGRTGPKPAQNSAGEAFAAK